MVAERYGFAIFRMQIGRRQVGNFYYHPSSIAIFRIKVMHHNMDFMVQRLQVRFPVRACGGRRALGRRN